MNVSVPTEPSPTAEPLPPAPIVIVTPEVALPYWTCVAPLPVIWSLPPLPWNALKPLLKTVRVIDVGKVAADRAIDAAGEGVVADRGRIASRRALRRTGAAGADRDRHASRRVGVDHLRIAVAGDGVVAAKALELVEVAVAGADVQRTRQAIAGRIVAVGQHGALDAFDVAQRIRADRGIAGGGTRRHVDGHAARDGAQAVVARGIEAAAAVDEVVAAKAGEVCC